MALNCYFEMKEKIVFTDIGKYQGYINSVWDVPGLNPAPLRGKKGQRRPEKFGFTLLSLVK